MPLSENEQRILAEIEKHLHQSDPRLARDVGRPSLVVGSSLRAGAFAALGGLALLVGALQIHFLLSFVGFLIMTAGALTIERALSESGFADGRRRTSSLAESLRLARPTFRRRNDR